MKNLLLVSLLLALIVLSCKKQELVSKEYKCSCNYSAYTLDHSSTYSVSNDTFTVTATSTEEAKSKCEAEEELGVWEIISVGCTAGP